MRRAVVRLGIAVALAGAAFQQGLAQPGSNGPGSNGIGARGPAAAGYTQLFISPCGEPYRGKPGDPYPVVLWFKQADLDHDGAISRAEFRADHQGFFEALDSDDNGYLDGPEVKFYETQVVPDVLGPDALGPNSLSLLTHPERAGARLWLAQVVQTPEGGHPGIGNTHGGYNPDNTAKGPADDLGARRPEKRRLIGAAPYGLLAEIEPVRAADSNLDGRVSKAEFLAAADRRFKALDKNGDGKLTLDELPMTAVQAAMLKRK